MDGLKMVMVKNRNLKRRRKNEIYLCVIDTVVCWMCNRGKEENY